MIVEIYEENTFKMWQMSWTLDIELFLFSKEHSLLILFK